jgi:hypothetical protein
MGDTMEEGRMKSGIGQKDLRHIPGGGISIENRLDIFLNRFDHSLNIKIKD